jgi:hypothetical protein
MKAICRALALALLLAPAASFAVKIPIPIDGATLNLSAQIQTQFLVNQNGAPDGTTPSFDIFMRRTRILVNGDASQNFTYLIQVDNANFGKYGNWTPRAIIQDAWVGWAPGGITGGSVLYFDAGILLIPFSHQLLESTTNFIAADVQTDSFRVTNSVFQGLRDTGIQVRGWAFEKKFGFRGGVYEGITPASPLLGTAPINNNQIPAVPVTITGTPPTGTTAQVAGCAITPSVGGPIVATSCLTPHRNPALGGFINFDIIGSEEGGWLYGAYKWGKDPILSIGFGDNYQSLAVRNLITNNLNDQNIFSADVYANIPMGGDAGEIVFEGTFYKNNNGTNTANTGIGAMADLGVRFGKIAPYIALDYFQATDCDLSNAPAAQQTALTAACNAQAAGAPHSADTREGKIGINYFFNKNLNHVNLEFAENHGQSTYGPTGISNANAGYAPLSLDPLTGTARRAFGGNFPAGSLRNPAYYSLLLHWNMLF